MDVLAQAAAVVRAAERRHLWGTWMDKNAVLIAAGVLLLFAVSLLMFDAWQTRRMGAPEPRGVAVPVEGVQDDLPAGEEG